MPDGAGFRRVDCDYSQQAKAALELENQIVTGCECLAHDLQKVTASRLSGNAL
jgi:hypothetical protein